MHPDAALILSDKCIAIELDHGTKGSQIRNALAKASFSVILGGFFQAMVPFFVDPPKSAVDLRYSKSEEKVLNLYQMQFHTTLYII